MKIYRMTATFGKLEHETLTLVPGLNILEAENEWGKSTWCAFLLAMFYGLDTRAKTTKTALADKERYAPWSGSPMSGSMDICWRGRDITIARSTRGRIPMGEFAAFETATGMVVPELTASNCGQMLLGVEQSVFRRGGFIRFSDLPVTQDESLRRRLNALVTTGDESGDGALLERRLRELKNKCRYNHTGLIPQAEAERDVLKHKLEEWESLERQVQKLQNRLTDLNQWSRKLENHRTALGYAAAEADAQRIAQARNQWEAAVQKQKSLETLCAKLPQEEQAQRKIRELKEYQQQWYDLQLEESMLPQMPETPEMQKPFSGMEPEAAAQMVAGDTGEYERIAARKPGLVQFLAAGICVLFGIFLAVQTQYLYCGGALVLGLLLWGLGIRSRKHRAKEMAVLEEKYGSPYPAQWQDALTEFTETQKQFRRELTSYRATRGDLDARIAAMKTLRKSLCGEQTPEKVMELWQQVLSYWEEFHNVRRETRHLQSHLETLQAMAKTVRKPLMTDSLTYTEKETARLISDAAAEQQRLQNRLGQYQGQMSALGDRKRLENQLEQVAKRLQKLEDTYAAAELSLETLSRAKRELQRKFAPRIAKRAENWMQEMTDGRYNRLVWGENFELSSGVEEQTVFYNTLWRSDGTVDQLYFALRLAVAEELMPEIPLILDDALVRFDDTRLKAALKIIEQLSQQKQVLLFTCHSREKKILAKLGENR